MLELLMNVKFRAYRVNQNLAVERATKSLFPQNVYNAKRMAGTYPLEYGLHGFPPHNYISADVT
jgi:hypothetical protein